MQINNNPVSFGCEYCTAIKLAYNAQGKEREGIADVNAIPADGEKPNPIDYNEFPAIEKFNHVQYAANRLRYLTWFWDKGRHIKPITEE